MGVQAFGDEHEGGHLMGDVPALVLVAVVLGYFSNSTVVSRTAAN
jgi:hypothetical protein